MDKYNANTKRISTFSMKLLAIAVVLIAASSAVFADNTRTLNLEEAVHLALERNRTVRVAKAEVRSSEYQVRDAKTNFFPHLAFKGTYTRLDERPYLDASGFGQMFEPLMAPFNDLVQKGYLDPGTLEGMSGGGMEKIYMGRLDNYSFNLSIQQPLFTGFAIRNGYRIAQQAQEAVRWNSKATEDQVRLNVTAAFLGLVKVSEFLTITKESIKQMGAHITDLENLFSEGMIIENDLLRARVQLSNIKLLKTQASNGVKLANAYLCNLLAIDLETTIVPEDVPTALMGAVDSLRVYSREAQVSRPELRVMKANLQIGEHLISIRRGEYLPKLFLIGNYDWKNPDRETNPEFYGSWNITLALQMNLFDWGSTHSKVQEARIDYDMMVEGSRMLADGISLEVKQSYLQLNEAREKLQISEENITQAEENFRVTRENFHEGLATNADLLDAQTSLTRTKLERATVHADLLLAQAKLIKAIGGNNEKLR